MPSLQAPSMEKQAEPLLAIRDLQVDFLTSEGTIPAVRGVSLHLDRGETLALVGLPRDNQPEVRQAKLARSSRCKSGPGKG